MNQPFEFDARRVRRAFGRAAASYERTAVLQREVVFGLDKQGIVDIAVGAARLCRKLEQTVPETAVRYEYSPESFTLTEPDFAIEICEAVMDVIEPHDDRPIIPLIAETGGIGTAGAVVRAL